MVNPLPTSLQWIEDVELVNKVYWPDASRTGEGLIIQSAQGIAEDNDHVKRHLPDMICSPDFDEYSMRQIRVIVGIASEGHCMLQIMLFHWLYLITELIGESFWKAFWECFCCGCHSPFPFNVSCDDLLKVLRPLSSVDQWHRAQL